MIYTLYLNTLQANSKTSGTASCNWQVNWDNLFQRKNLEYRRCRVRFSFEQLELESTTAPTDDDWQYHFRAGYLGTSLQSTQQATNDSYTIAGSILGLIKPQNIMSWTADGAASNVTTWCQVNGSTLSSSRGPEFFTPVGTTNLNIQLNKFALNEGGSPSLYTNYSHPWHILLEFELLEDD